MSLPIALRRLLSIRVRDKRELTYYVMVTTAVCALIALAFDVANQMIFFETWTIAFRSWLVTVIVVVVIAAPVSSAFGKAHLALYRLSQTDPLTGLLNRRALLDAIEEPATYMALIIVDIDRFKLINDTYGHLVGDQVLRAVAQMMRHMLHGLGRVGRLGGEEFALLASIDDRKQLLDRLESFRAKVAETPVLAGSKVVSATISAGLAARSEGQTFEQLYARADKALYMAKASGRNRIVDADNAEAAPGLARLIDPAPEDWRHLRSSQM